MNILVTGANGQLGNEMQRVAMLSAHHYTFTDVDTLDICDLDAVRAMVAQVKADVIVNCAAYTNVDKAETDSECADRINHLAVNNLAVAACEADATLIHISTDYVFPGTSSTPYNEDCPTQPLGVYGATKLAGELAVKASGCKYIIIRTAWLYSVYGNNFVKTMRRLTAERPTLNVVFDQVGTPTYAGDLADVIATIINDKKLCHTGVYHFSNEGVCSWYDFAVAIASLSGNDCLIKPILSEDYPTAAARPHFSVLDKAKIRNTFGVTIPHWYASLVKCINQLDRK